jgi:predicted transcriptional regulator of viral defense system
LFRYASTQQHLTVPEPMSNPPTSCDNTSSVRGSKDATSEGLSVCPTGRDKATSVRGGASDPSAPVRVAAIAAEQWGVIDIRQLSACGVGRSMASRWTAEGRLHRVYRGVYAVGHPALPVEGELTAALFHVGPGATISHETAAWWWGLIEEQPRELDISVTTRRRATQRLRTHTRRQLDRTWHRRLPVTTVPQTFLDLAAATTVSCVRRALAEAEFRGVVNLDAVSAVLGRGRPGSATLRVALSRHEPALARSRSRLEAAFFALCETAGLPLPELNAPLLGYKIDALWRDQLVAVELDGYEGHRTRAQLERDHQRDLTLRLAGFVVLRYTWEQITRNREEVIVDLTCALSTQPR